MKKLISLLAASAAMVITAATVSAAEPSIYIDIIEKGTKAGETVTVAVKYKDFDVTEYNDDEGAGAKMTGYQWRIDIPGGIGSATQNEQFLRSGATTTNKIGGTLQGGYDIANNYITGVVGGAEFAMAPSGTLYEFSMKLQNDVTEDLVFKFNEEYATNADFGVWMFYDNYVDWAIDGDTVMTKFDYSKLTTATLEAPAPAAPVFSAETTDKGLYKEDDVQAGIFYNLAIKNNAGDVDITVDGKTFTTEGLIKTENEAVLDLTVVIVGYPNATVPACTVTEVAAQ